MEHLPEALYCAADTRSADRRAVRELGLKAGELMERAGQAAFALLRECFPRARRIAVLCGRGDNGGDGYVLARLARQVGLDVSVYTPGATTADQGDAAVARANWLQAGGSEQQCSSIDLTACDVLVDGLFGTGLTRPLEGAWRAAVEAMNACGRPILALDIPSGLDADCGQIRGAAVRASVTLSFIGLKAGLFTGQGRDHAGQIRFADLGVPASVYSSVSPRARRMTGKNMHPLLPPRPRSAHKGDAGRVLVIGGQAGMAGAVQLAGLAAYRSGAGRVVLATHPGHAALISAAHPELISYGVDDDQTLTAFGREARVVALGPGLGQSVWSQLLWKAGMAADTPLVVDADALNLLAVRPRRNTHWVLTPHPGEAARLLGISIAAIEADRFAAVRAIVEKFGGVCVLKGSGTLITAEGEPAIWLCDRGNPGMATAGSGDVLTGTIAGLLGQGLTALDAARLGVWLHACAGDHAARQGERGLMASDLLPALRHVIAQFDHDAG